MTKEKEKEADKIKKKRYTEKDYPYISLDEAINVVRKINELGGFATKADLQQVLKRKGGWLGVTIVSTKRYGLVEGHGKLNLTEQAKKIIAPTYAGEEVEAKKQAFFDVPLFNEIYSRFNGNYPADDLFINILMRNHSIKNKREAIKLMNIIKENTKSVFGANKENAENFDVATDNIPMKHQENLTMKDNLIIQKIPAKVSIAISSSWANFSIPVKDKEEFKIIRKEKLNKILDTIEALWPEEINQEKKGEEGNEE